MSLMVQRHLAISVKAAFIAYGAPAIAIVAYASYWLIPAMRTSLPIWFGRPPNAYPFNDLDAILLAIGCAGRGVDVTVPNACMGGGLFQYSPLLLTATALPIGPWLRVPLGLGLDATFLLSLYALPHPRRWREFWCLLLAALSCSTYWALESANLDIALYLLVLLGVHLLMHGVGMRMAGYAAILVAGAIKFYPACLMVLAVRERPARFLTIALTSLAGAGLFALMFAGQLGHILPRLPHDNPFGGTFGATNLPGGIATLLTSGDADGTPSRVIRFASTIGLICLCALSTRRWMPALLPTLRTLAPRPRMLLVAGAASMTFCFFAAQNILYRQIFLMLTLPGLWDLARDASQPPLCARFRLASWVVVGLMWSYFFHILSVAVPVDRPGGQLIATLLVWIVQEALWWRLIGLFATIVLCFLWDSPLLAHRRARAPSAAC